MNKFNLKKLLTGLLLTAILAIPFSTQAVVIPEGRATSGDLTISGSTTENGTKSAITTLANSGDTAVIVSSASGFVAGDYIYIGQMQGTGAGNYEINKIRSISSNTLNLFNPTISAYQSTGAQVIRLAEYHNVTVANGGTWSASAWNGTTGGVLIALLNGGLTLQTGGTITMSTNGFSGGSGAGQGGASCGTQGTGTSGTGSAASSANGNGGGAGCQGVGNDADSGGGGGQATAGTNGSANSAGVGGTGGSISGSASLSTSMAIGGGAGGAQCNTASCSATSGGTGGGIIFIATASTTVTAGTFTNVGGNSSACSASGGASGGSGAGGSIRLPVRLALNLGSTISAIAGTVGTTNCTRSGGSGATGRVATVSGPTVTGTASPTIDTSSTDRVQNKDNEAMTLNLSASM